MRKVLSEGRLGCLVAGCLAIGCLFFNGCTPAAETPTEDVPEINIPVQVDDKPFEIRDSMKGRWIFRLVRQTLAIPFALIDIEEVDGGFKVNPPISAAAADAPVFNTGSATRDSIELTFDLANGLGTLEFSGRLIDGTVRGTVQFTGSNVAIAFMQPSEMESIPSQQPQMLPFNREYEKIGRAEDQLSAFRDFVASHPQSALTIDAFTRSLVMSKTQKMPPADIEVLVSDFRASAEVWGPKRLRQVPMDVAAILGGLEYQPKLASKYLSEYRASLTEDELNDEKIKQALSLLESKIEFAGNLDDLGDESPDVQSAAINRLQDLLEKEPLNSRATLALGSHYRENSDLDNAIKHYARLIAVPSLEKTIVDEIMARDPSASLPGQQLTELWQKKHGKLSGLDDYLNQSYREAIGAFSKEGDKVAPREKGDDNKVMLLELFTSGSSAECIAADASIGIVESLFQPTELIVLRYHQHVPSPDPLASREGNERFRYYNGKMIPTMFLNGKGVSHVAGSIDLIPVLAPAIKKMVDEAINEKVDMVFDMTASRLDDEIKVSVSVDNIDDSDGGEYYLRMVLAENEVTFKAGNGIRVHKMVTRVFPGGYRGIAVTDRKVTYEGTIQLAEVKKQLNNELAMVEQMTGAPMPNRPLDFSNMRLVAMIQDEVDRRVVQSRLVDVTATGSTPVAADAEPAPAKGDSSGAAAKESKPEPQPKSEPKSAKDEVNKGETTKEESGEAASESSGKK